MRQGAVRSPVRSAVLAVLAVVLAGCFQAEAPPPTDVPQGDLVRTTADGGVAGPDAAVQIQDEDPGSSRPLVFYPYDLPGGRARAPAGKDITDKFETADCASPLFSDDGPTRKFQMHDITDLFEAGDVVHIEVWANWTNKDDSWADLHLMVDLPTGGMFDTIDRGRDRGVFSVNFTSQVYWRGDAGDRAQVGMVCFYGASAQPVPYTLNVRVSYAENVVPASAPVLVKVPSGATRLMITGVPVGERPVTSHFRLFAPDDSLVGEYALNSNELIDAAFVPGPGEYVIMVDHTEGGFVSFGADAPPEDNVLVALDTVGTTLTLHSQDVPGPAAATVPFTIPRVPLVLLVFPEAPDASPSYAFGRNFHLVVEGPRGLVLNFFLEGFGEAEGAGQNVFIPAGLDFTFEYDHHALAVGDHVAALDADAFRGELEFNWATYLRPGEQGVAPPKFGSGTSGAPDGDASTEVVRVRRPTSGQA